MLEMKIRIRGFEDPLTARLAIEGFEDPLTALKEIRAFEEPLFEEVSFRRPRDKLQVRTAPV